MGGVFVLREDGQLVEMSGQQFESEDAFQDLLARHTKLLPGDQISSTSPRRWLLISREMGVPSEQDGGDRWSLDHLLLDQDGIPTFVEVKRSSDTRIRREVVGQMLDYAANAVVYWSVEQMSAAFERDCEHDGIAPAERLPEFLGDERDPGEFWQLVKTNLQAGKIRLLFVADIIPQELRRIVEFLNEQMDPAEVLAVEVRLFEGEGMKTLVPRVYGQTVETERKKRPGKSTAKPALSESEFLARVDESCGPGAAGIVRRILEWTRERLGEPRWGSTSFSVAVSHNGFRHTLFNIWDGAGIAFLFGRIRTREPFNDESRLREFAQRLNKIPDVNIDRLEGEPRFELSALGNDDALEQFIEAVEWAVTQIEES